MTMTSDLQHDADTTGPTGGADTWVRRAFGDQLGADAPGRAPTTSVKIARTAGLLYLVVAILGGFAQIVRVQVYAPGNAAVTAGNIVAHATLVRLSFVADLIQALVWLVLAVTLHRLLAHAGRNMARAMVVFVAVSAAITSLNLVHQLGALLVATNDSYVSALGADGSHALVLLMMDLHHYGYLIAQLAWLWLFALGWLGYRSGMLPTWLCLLLMLGTVCYVIDALTQFLAPSLAGASAAVFVLPEIVCEVSLLVYLLVKGVRTPPAAAPIPAAA
jgi:ethanolamine utilization microcompartment shell protein EutS